MYCIIIIVSVILISLLNCIFLQDITGFLWYEIIIWSISLTIIVIILDGLFAFIVRRIMPKKLYAKEHTHFVAGKKLRRFYENIGVKRWKDKVLELGVFTGFSKKQIIEPKNNDYVERFIIECNYGVGVHLADMLVGFIILFLCPKSIMISIALPIALVNLMLNYMPYIILRYNLHKLHKIYALNLTRENKKII